MPLPAIPRLALSRAAASAAASHLQRGEDALLRAILRWSNLLGYSRFTSTLEEPWRLSVRGLNAALVEGLASHPVVPDLGPDDDGWGSAVVAFAVEEADRHRARGMNLAMFLGLFKYYRQVWDDHLDAGHLPEGEVVRRFVARLFDRMEIAYCTRWAGESAERQIQLLAETARVKTAEKNRLLTFFESLDTPAFLLDAEGALLLFNRAAAALLDGPSPSGRRYYDASGAPPTPPWITAAVADPAGTVRLELGEPPRPTRIHAERMKDLSGRFEGWAVLAQPER